MLSRRTFFVTFAAPWVQGQNGPANMFGDAEAYERFMGRWSHLVAAPFGEFTGLPDYGRILDAGSGTGSMAFAVSGRHRELRVVGIDPSSEYVAWAGSKDPFPDRVTFEVGDAQKLTFADASLDGAVSLLVFNFIPDPKKALAELRRVIRPGGRISAAVWDYGDGMRMLRAFWDAAAAIDPAAEKSDEKHMPLCRSGELAALWKQGGLENIREQPIDVQMPFESFADFWDPFLLGQGPAGAWVRRLDRSKLPALRDHLKRRLSVHDEKASFSLPARVWAVRGTVPGHP